MFDNLLVIDSGVNNRGKGFEFSFFDFLDPSTHRSLEP